MARRFLIPAALFLLFLAAATGVRAQVVYEPTPPPAILAADRDWYRSGAPVPFAGDLYYPTGPTVYFNGNTMVPTGQYDGVTLYADTTIEPYSVIYVPVADNILRPYQPIQAWDQRRGTLGGNPPSFGYAGQEPYRGPAEPVERPHPGRRRQEASTAPPAAEYYPFEQPLEFRLETVKKPTGSIGIWLSFQGRRWESAGPAVPLDPAKMANAGDYLGFPVYADPQQPYVIYLPTLGNLVAPFRRTP